MKLFREGQTTEDEIFSNIVGSQSFDEFLSFLGKKIELNGFKEYRGGLDVTGNLTGTHSIFTQWKDFQIMYPFLSSLNLQTIHFCFLKGFMLLLCFLFMKKINNN